MTDVTAAIGVSIDSAGALAQLRQLQAGISQFNQSVISSNAAAAAKQRDLISTFAAQVEGTKQFSTSIANVETSVGRLGETIDSGKLKLGEYFKYGVASATSSGKLFAKQHAEIMSLATDRVKRLQTQYVALGESANGMQKALAVRPLNLFNSQAAVATQRMQIFNKLMHDGTTSLINWGKNTQWAGRQLMVGFTVPLTIFGAMAAKTFTEIEKAMVSFKRVYGDTMTTDVETNKALDNIKSLANEYTKYGVAVSDTISLAAKAAATGAEGGDLVAQTREATRLATLGQIDYQKALDTTISLQAAFGVSSKDLGSNIDFLNAVENQTVLSIDDLTEAIPRVAPVVRGLGGDVKDLAYMLTAMREGGVSAAEGANALKSGLASLINPTKGAIEKAKELNIDLAGLAETHPGDLAGMVKEFSDAIKGLDGLSRQQLLNKVFGKNQYAKMAAMFAGISKEGSQASRVLDLMGQSTQTLANLSGRELSKVEDAINVKWTGSIERLKASIAPIGETFLKVATPIVDKVTELFNWFNNLNPAVQTFGVVAVAALGVVLPTVTMLIGLFANMIGNIAKFPFALKSMASWFRKAGGDTEYLATAELDTMAAAASLEGRVTTLTSSLNIQSSAVARLTAAYQGMSAAAAAALKLNPAGFRVSKIAGYADGRVPIVPGSGSGNKDTEFAMLAPGEAVINAKSTKKFGPALAAINSGNLPGHAGGKTKTTTTSMIGGQPVEWIPVNQGRGKTNVAKMEMLISEVEAEGSQFAKMLVNMFNELQGKIVSVNAIASKLSDTGIKNLVAISDKYKTEKGLGAPNSYGDRKAKGLEARPGLAAYFSDQFKTTTAATRQWAKTHGQTIPAGALSEAQFGTHVSHLSKTSDESGKQWMAKRVAVDSGYINRYLQDTESALGRFVKTIVEMDTGGTKFTVAEKRAADLLMQSAKDVGLSANQARKELALLAQGMHPVTKEAVMAVKAVANTDLTMAQQAGWKGKTALGTSADSAWKAYAAQQAAQFSLNNNGASRVKSSTGIFAGLKGVMYDKSQKKYRDMSSQEFAEADKAATSVLNKVKRFASKFANGLATSLATAGGSLDAAQNALGIHSPAAAFVKVGEGTKEGAYIAAKEMKSGTKILRTGIVELATSVLPATRVASRQIISGGDSLTRAIKAAGLEINEAALLTAKTSAASAVTTGATKPKSGIGGKLSKGLFATDALFMAGSFLPGQIGELSQQLMFASMGVQALTGAFSGLQGLIGGTKLAGAFTSLITSGPLAGTAIAALASPVGIAVAAITALGGVAWLAYQQHQKNQEYIHGLGQAAKVTAEQMNNLSSSFGFTARATGQDVTTSTTGDAEAQKQAVTAKSFVASDEDMKKKVETLKTATAQEAQLVLTSVYTGLIARGAPADLASQIIEQVSLAAGKETVFINVKGKLAGLVDKDGKPNFSTAAKEVKNTVSGVMAGVDMGAVNGVKTAEANEAAAIARTTAMLDAKNAAWDKWHRMMVDGVSTTEDLIRAENEYYDAERNWTSANSDSIRATEEFSNAQMESKDALGKYTREMEASTEAVNNFVNLASASLMDGTLSWEDYTKAISELQTAFKDTPDQGLDMLKGVLGGIIDADESLKPVKDSILKNVGDVNTALSMIGALRTGNTEALAAVKTALITIANNTDPAAVTQNVAILQAALASIPGIIAQSSGAGDTAANAVASITKQISAKESEIAKLKAANKSSKGSGGGGGGGGGTPKSKYDKKADKIAKANARLDIAEVKIDKTEDAKLQAAMNKRWGGKTIKVDGLKVTVKHAADIEYAMEQIDEKIEDINRNEIDPLNDKLDELNDKQDKINRQVDVWQQKVDKVNEAYESQLKPLERANDLLENQKAGLEEQRDKQLEGIDLQVTALQNQIDIAEYAADQQSKLLDDQIEKNNINAELINKQVDAIQTQIDALQEVQQINEILSAQKQSQLNLASALSRGDAGAAAGAMLESQSTAASGASQLQQAGLEKQQGDLQGQADALTAQNDLLSKRKDAIQKGVDGLNAQLSALQQQRTVIENNYKIELQTIANSIAANQTRIRQLEYERDVRTQYWQDQIDKYAPELRDLENQIYAIEQKIKTIQDQKVQPLERQKDLLDDILGDVQQQISREKSVIEQKRKQLDYANKINSAMKTLYDRTKSAAGASGGIGAGLSSGAKELKKAQDELKKLKEKLRTEEFKMKVEQGMVVRTKGGGFKVFNSPSEAAIYTSGVFSEGARTATKADILGSVKVGGKTITGEKNWDKIATAIADVLDNKANKPVIAGIYADKDKYKIKITKSDDGVELSGPRKARGGLIPGFRGVAMGDNIMTYMRSGEGVTVSEALKNNKYETKRLLALNSAALSGNMSSFYKEWSAPELAPSAPVIQPVAVGTGGDIYHDYRIEVNAQGTNVTADEIVNKVIYKINDIQRSQVRSR